MSEDNSTSPADNTPPLDEDVQNQENDEQDNLDMINTEAAVNAINGCCYFTVKMQKFLAGFYYKLHSGQVLARDLFSRISPDGYRIDLPQDSESIKIDLEYQFKRWRGTVGKMPNSVLTRIVGEIMIWQKRNPEATEINLNLLRIEIKKAIYQQLESDRIADLSLDAMPGIGPKTVPKLQRCGIRTVAKLIDRYNQAPDQFQSVIYGTVRPHKDHAQLTTQALVFYTMMVTRQQPPVSIYQPLVDVVVTACKKRPINTANHQKLNRQIKMLIEKFVPED